MHLPELDRVDRGDHLRRVQLRLGRYLAFVEAAPAIPPPQRAAALHERVVGDASRGERDPRDAWGSRTPRSGARFRT